MATQSLFAILAGVALLMLFVRNRVRTYSYLFGEDHYMEFAQEVDRIKQAALGQVETHLPSAPYGPDDPRVMHTSADMVVFYVIARDKNLFRHRFTVHLAGRFTPSFIGEMFSLYIITLLGEERERFRLSITLRSVFVGEIMLTSREQEMFAFREIAAPTRDSVRTTHTGLLLQCRRVRFNRFG
jgi:hypothetical protein